MVLGAQSVWPGPNSPDSNQFIDEWKAEIFYVIVGSAFLLLLARIVRENLDAIRLKAKSQRRFELNLQIGECRKIGPISGHRMALITIRLDLLEEKKNNTVEVQLQCGDSGSVSPARGVLIESPSMVERTLEMRIHAKDAWSHDLIVTCLRTSLPTSNICLTVQVASKDIISLPSMSRWREDRHQIKSQEPEPPFTPPG